MLIPKVYSVCGYTVTAEGTYCGDNVWKMIYKCVSNSYSALSVRYGSNTARGPRASAVLEAILHTERTITIIYAVTTAP